MLPCIAGALKGCDLLTSFARRMLISSTYVGDRNHAAVVADEPLPNGSLVEGFFTSVELVLAVSPFPW